MGRNAGRDRFIASFRQLRCQQDAMNRSLPDLSSFLAQKPTVESKGNAPPIHEYACGAKLYGRGVPLAGALVLVYVLTSVHMKVFPTFHKTLHVGRPSRSPCCTECSGHCKVVLTDCKPAIRHKHHNQTEENNYARKIGCDSSWKLMALHLISYIRKC